MNPTLLIPYYLSWHYSLGFKGLLSLVKTFTWFLWNFFSIGLLLKTLFAPFERLQESKKGRGLDVEAFFSALATNLIMRVVGVIVRGTVIVIGLVSMIGLWVAWVISIVAWLLLPLLLVILLVASFLALFKVPTA